MSEVYKHFKSGEKKITNAVTHKHWELNSNTTASLKVLTLTGSLSSQAGGIAFALNDDNQGASANEILNTHNGFSYYPFLLYHSIYNLYYDRGDTSYDQFCNSSPSKSYRLEYGDKTTVLSIPGNIYGEKIKPGSLIISQSEHYYTDDKFGNLIDTTDTSGSAALPIILSSSINLTFDKNMVDLLNINGTAKTSGLEYENQTTASIAGGNYGLYDGRAFNVSFANDTSGVNGPYVRLHGSHSLQESHSVAVPHDNSIIEIYDTKGFEMPDDWSISFYVNCPPSQSVTSSYSGNFSGDNSKIVREFKSRDTNVILTSREWFGGNCPFEIAVYNSSNVDNKGKVKFFAKSKSGPQSLTINSTATINDGDWHHILVTKNSSLSTNNVQFYIDGASQGQGTYPTNNTKAPINFHIGARPYNFKQKRYDDRTQKFRTDKKNRNYLDPFSGSLDGLIISNYYVPDTNVANVSSSFGHNYVGNVFYDHGIININHNTKAGKYNQKYRRFNSAFTELKFRGTHMIKEHLYVCNILDGEFNATYNPTAREKFDPRNSNLQAYTTHSEFNPYVTSIGLYDDYNNLIAVGKLAQPIKNQDDYDNSFVIRFDTTV
tara:strand:- start:118 stop:1926 length:1809 start_codon:yes stop_codon:yes gene_type:complete